MTFRTDVRSRRILNSITFAVTRPVHALLCSAAHSVALAYLDSNLPLPSLLDELAIASTSRPQAIFPEVMLCLLPVYLYIFTLPRATNSIMSMLGLTSVNLRSLTAACIAAL